MSKLSFIDLITDYFKQSYPYFIYYLIFLEKYKSKKHEKK